jgi:hypothetical protein
VASEGTQLLTTFPDGSDPVLLSQLGYVTGLGYNFTTPGGCNQLQATLALPGGRPFNALNAGRLVWAMRGGTIAWAGINDEPTQGDDGWQMTAHGAGGFGDDYLAIFSVAWGTAVFNDAVDQAIGRGMAWIRNTDIGAVAGLWTGQAVDSGGQTITDLLTLGTHKGGLTWEVRTVPRGNILTVFAIPTTANRILIVGDPLGRSVGDAPTTLYERYQASADSGNTPAAFALTSVTSQLEGVITRREDLMDISSAGTYTAGQAQAVGNRALARYQRIAFADAVTVQPGELLNLGGQPVDLGLFWQDGITSMVCELWLANYPYGGELAGGPTNILVGQYDYNPDGTATITPFDSQRHDWSSVMGAAVDSAPVRTKPTSKAKRKAKK